MSTKKLIVWILAFVIAIPAYFLGGLYVWSVVKSTFVDYNTLMSTYEILKLSSYSGVVLLFSFICILTNTGFDEIGAAAILSLLGAVLQYGLMVMFVYFNWVKVASIGYILYNLINVGVMIGTFGIYIFAAVTDGDDPKPQKASQAIQQPIAPKPPVVRDNSVDQRFEHL